MKTMICYVDGSWKPSYPDRVGGAAIIVNDNDTTEELMFYRDNSAFENCSSLVSVNIPSARVLNGYAFTKCSALEYLDLQLVTTIGSNCFSKTGLKTLILRASQVARLAGVSALNETPIANGTGYIYVPSSLLAN